MESVNSLRQRHSTGNPTGNSGESGRPFRHYRFKVKRISRTWQSRFPPAGLSRSLSFSSSQLRTSARVPLCGRERSALSAPTKRPSSPTYRFRHSNLARIPAANVLSRPDKDRILREIKSLRYPSVRVSLRRSATSTEKRFTPRM